MHVENAEDQKSWDDFLATQRYRPFLQSWTMGEVYRDCGEAPVRLIIRKDATIVGICQAIVVDAKRGRHLAIPYGPVIDEQDDPSETLKILLSALHKVASEHRCSFIRMSPFLENAHSSQLKADSSSIPSPLHLLAEHVWYLPLVDPDPWQKSNEEAKKRRSEEALLSAMRKTTRNLIRRAEKEGVTIERSNSPLEDLHHFIKLHDETRKRHGFTPYSNAFFRAQVLHFAPRGECSLYLAHYQGNIIAASIHMHACGETSYHHGASSHAFQKIPASTLLQWTAIRDALKRGDYVYNFWGIAPLKDERDTSVAQSSKLKALSSQHPFSGVTLFKTGFGGQVLNLMHCQDIPIRRSYYLTRWFEMARKWKRGF